MTSICQIRDSLPALNRGIEWIIFGSTAFSAALPVYPNVSKMPAYLSEVTLDTDTHNFYWASRLIGALADPHYGSVVQLIERYHAAVAVKSRMQIREYDQKFAETSDPALLEEANEKLAEMAEKETTSALNKVLFEASVRMKNGYNRADN